GGGAVGERKRTSARLADGYGAAKQAARGGGAESNYRGRLDEAALVVEPHLAALDLIVAPPLVQAPLAAHLVLEMLDGVGDEHFLARNTGLFQRPVEHAAGGPHEGLARDVLLIAGLLADQHEMRALPAFAGHRLGSVVVERASPARLLGSRKFAQRAH